MSGQADPYTPQVNIQSVSAWSDSINKTISYKSQADPYTRHVNIEWVSAQSDIINETILDEQSGWPIYTSSKYSAGIRLIRHQQPDNIG
jgi:hypothetical protein